MDRRRFIKESCSVCVALGSGYLIGALSSCSSFPTLDTDIVEGTIRVPLTAFAQGELLILRVRSLIYDIALRKYPGNSYTAILLRCTHAETQLSASGDAYACSAHGSRFDSEGHVMKGPARKDLERFGTEVMEGNILIHVAGRNL
jgi:nitrite reductase/ring-hydroxylating ferredoxin subunit